MTTLRFIFGDQLSASTLPSLTHLTSDDIIFMTEINEEATQNAKHHKKKLVFLFSAMRHFAQHLMETTSAKVIYSPLDEPEKTHSFTSECERIIKAYSIKKIVITEPSEYRILNAVKNWESTFKIPVDILEDTRYLANKSEFNAWASGKKQLRMEFFYREMRRKYSILIDDNEPTGGKWNYDSENRKPPTQAMKLPAPPSFEPSAITKEVITLIEHTFSHHFGDIYPFNYAVTQADANTCLEDFLNYRLTQFGDYQDAMLKDEPFMFHSVISMYINCGLLDPLTCIKAAENAYENNKAPLNAVEGFIRQVLGWREYIRGIYWLHMPDYKTKNALAAKRPLPSFFWDGNTEMACLKDCINTTKKHAYAHHIQRLMVLGNFALLAQLDPAAVNEWYLIVYADAYEWVEMPNVTGMALYADGGIVASKPYAASGSYINKMSNYCKECRYAVKEKLGPNACPFNVLYWNFFIDNQEKLASNHRTQMTYRTLSKMDDKKKAAIKKQATYFLNELACFILILHSMVTTCNI